MKGAFQTSREIFENPIWQDIPKFRIFFYIVGNAVYAEEGAVVAGVHLQRGQFLRAYRNLIKDLEYIENRSVKRYSLSVISRKIDQLVKEERLKIEDTELGTLFTVVNYAQYQGFDYYKKRTWDSVGTDLERSENGDGTELEQGWNNNNKENKDKKEKNKKDSIPKIQFSESVSLTQSEYDRLVSEFGEGTTKQAIDYLTSYKEEKGYKTKSDNLTIRRWVIDAVTKKGGSSFGKHQGNNGTTTGTSKFAAADKNKPFDPRELEELGLQ
ncbi:hypothetical protein EHV15_05335 [Paenibacillus oralis]|uniref:Uncharacterized protein n=1 Tax=Paenibacillus oralis TaxID=2490856 RepID=A0A3P3TWD0_9BACL|nr:hypothetical protein [Paenibacillus oralis]RRJ62437.1 hypothetical protein EHV15_05335 [Paenibacillus oralis]